MTKNCIIQGINYWQLVHEALYLAAADENEFDHLLLLCLISESRGKLFFGALVTLYIQTILGVIIFGKIEFYPELPSFVAGI